MCAALGAGERVDLVDDDRLDSGESLSGLTGEQQEERLRGRDQDIARTPCEQPPLVSGCVARPDRHGDLGLGEPEAARGVPNADERAAQVALDVDGQRLHR